MIIIIDTIIINYYYYIFNIISVYGFDSEGNLIGNFTGGGINGPWDVTVDGDDNLWVSNFGPLSLGIPYLIPRISKLAGANPKGRPAGLRAGDPITSR